MVQAMIAGLLRWRQCQKLLFRDRFFFRETVGDAGVSWGFLQEIAERLGGPNCTRVGNNVFSKKPCGSGLTAMALGVGTRVGNVLPKKP